MREYYVDTEEKLAALSDELAGSDWLAMDTEFIREKTYYPRLCLIQVCNGDIAACVDPLAIDRLDPFLSLLFDGSIVKVLHAARQDLEIFLHRWRQIPLPLFDTQPAAALLGYGDQVGYAGLVKQLLHIDLPKDQSRTDWSHRPLNDNQIRYALDDVIHLGELYLTMRGRLSERDRLQWLTADFAELANPLTYAPDPMDVWKKIKGRQHLKGRQLAVLQQLANWREQRARERDLPRKWILKDDVMVELARRLPQDAGGLSRIRGMEPGQIRRDGTVLVELIKNGCELPREQWPEDKRRPKPLTHQQEAMVDLLSAALRLVADQHQLSPVAIATQKELQKLVRGESDCSLNDGWRHAVAGRTLHDVMAGKLHLVNHEGHLSLEN